MKSGFIFIIESFARVVKIAAVPGIGDGHEQKVSGLGMCVTKSSSCFPTLGFLLGSGLKCTIICCVSLISSYNAARNKDTSDR